MYLKELEDIGLTQREIKVYLSLLEIGTSSVGKIIKKSGIPGSKIYETLSKLKQRGFVSSIIRQGKQFFSAAEPRTILAYLDEQRRIIAETTLPQLEVLQKERKKEREATIYDGYNGIKSIYERILRTLKKGQTFYVLGAVKAQEKLEPYLLYFNKRRIKVGIKMKIIYHPDAREFGKVREKMPLTEVRYLKKEVITPAWMDVFGDHVVIFDLADIPTAVLIRDENVAKSFRTYFETIWNLLNKS
ncbi:hypothetical protein HYS50_00250 [Candidatus Woesearchaeota archaeon]|nr:hypothetical protein [Candidatus Woesearchaeota archaeon]